MASTFTLITLFVGFFILSLLIYSGISTTHNLDNTNTSDTQDISNQQLVQQEKTIQPVTLGISGYYWVILFVLVFAGIGYFIHIIWGKAGRGEL